ncbi:MAG: hypothetical protein Q9162_001462 [Coniocarpon cinnabarinum]
MGVGGGFVGGGSGSSSSSGGSDGGIGGGGSAPIQSSALPQISISTQPPPPPSTQTVASSQPPSTVVQTQLSTQISVYTPPPSDPVTVVHTEESTQLQTTSVPPSTITQDPSTAFITGPTSTITPVPVLITTAQATTISGKPITHFITSTPSAMPSASPATQIPQRTESGLSKGAVAGVTVGALGGAALVAGLIFLLCLWRRKNNKHSHDAEGFVGAPKRNASVLSRVGLLRGGSTANDGHVEPTLPRITTSGLPAGSGPQSAVTVGSWEMGENRRFSRPLFSDNRLNPNAIMQQNNISRTSVSTLQDNQDYSRPLEIRNPDR